MAVSTSLSLMLSSIMAVILFAGMQMNKHFLAADEKMTLVGGFLGSILFVLILTAVSNFETITFGSMFQSKIFPEVAVSMLIAVCASGTIHRVCATSCLILSSVVLYYLNRISLATYSVPDPKIPVRPSQSKQKKRN